MDVVPTSRLDSIPGPILSVVIVNYQSWDDVLRIVPPMVASDEVATGACEVLVVDNASSRPVPAELVSPRSGLRVIVNSENVGFAAGVNTGWRASRGRWLLLLNPDVELTDGFLAAVLKRVAHHEEAGAPGIVGFRLVDPDGTVQPSVGYEPSLPRSLRGLFIPRRGRKYQSVRRHRAGPVPWVTGAFALVDAGLLGALGGMDEDFFLYYEEVALCQSARMRGRQVVYDPSLAITHLRPLQNRRLTAPLRVMTRHSKLLYFRKHLPSWQFVGLSWIIGLEAWARRSWASWRGAESDERTWRAVGTLARHGRQGRWIVGTAVRDLALLVAHPRGRRTMHARPSGPVASTPVVRFPGRDES